MPEDAAVGALLLVIIFVFAIMTGAMLVAWRRASSWPSSSWRSYCGRGDKVVTTETTDIVAALTRIIELLEQLVRALDRIETQRAEDQIAEALARIESHAARTNELVENIGRSI